MTPSHHARVTATTLVVAALALAACRGAGQEAVRTTPAPSPAPATPPAAAAVESADLAAIARARADSVRRPYTEADIQFMTRMIGHHAQAITMARMAATHGASPSVRTLAERIINAQRDEIATMQRWLRDRRRPAPEPDTTGLAMHDMHDMHDMPGMAGMGGAHDMHGATAATASATLMPGMLTAEHMQRLDAARGHEFDRLFLSSMIQHHQGALVMVKALFGSYGAAQDETVFKFASDVNVDQTTEIARMRTMLAALLFEDDSL
ncbi:MAG TPA: DUF305 domain-containing protein [Gemmatimonadaceae bacterium]|nr:DUF305 domain-containing protein [Gemmatimonadaceae bacterium]